MWVTFGNGYHQGLGGAQHLVTFGSTFGGTLPPGSREAGKLVAGSGVQNGVDGTYVAQLYRVDRTSGNETSVGAAANFRSLNTVVPGTWSGFSAVIPGALPGEVVWLRVKAWDKAAGSYEGAVQSFGFAYGQSAVFSYSQPATITDPSDTWPINFKGFAIKHNLATPFGPWSINVPTVSVIENESVPVPDATLANGEPVSREQWYWALELWFWWSGVVNRDRLSEVDGRLLYYPPSHTYGLLSYADDSINLTFEVRPSARRPYMAVVQDPFIWRVALRGLEGRRYRVERSTDLAKWDRVGEFTANSTEVTAEAVSATSLTTYFRAVDVSP